MQVRKSIKVDINNEQWQGRSLFINGIYSDKWMTRFNTGKGYFGVERDSLIAIAEGEHVIWSRSLQGKHVWRCKPDVNLDQADACTNSSAWLIREGRREISQFVEPTKRCITSIRKALCFISKK